MKTIRRILGRQVTKKRVDTQLGMLACFLGGVGVLGTGFYKLSTLVLTEVEAFFGILLVLAVALQLVILGLLLQQKSTPKPEEPKQHA